MYAAAVLLALNQKQSPNISFNETAVFGLNARHISYAAEL